MVRVARIGAPGLPHHIRQHGDRRMPNDDDHCQYLSLIGHWCGQAGSRIWAYCLEPNHVHLIVVPETAARPYRGIGQAHRRWSANHSWRMTM